MKLQAKMVELEMAAYKTRPVDVMVWTAPHDTELLPEDDSNDVLLIPKGDSLVLAQETTRIVSPATLKAEYAPTRPRNSEPTTKPKRTRRKRT